MARPVAEDSAPLPINVSLATPDVTDAVPPVPNVTSNDFLNGKSLSILPDVSRKRRIAVAGRRNTAISNDGSDVFAFLPFEPKISALPLACPAPALYAIACTFANPNPADILISVRKSLYCVEGRPGVPV